MINNVDIKQILNLLQMYEDMMLDLQKEVLDREKDHCGYYKHRARVKRMGMTLRQEMIEFEKYLRD